MKWLKFIVKNLWQCGVNCQNGGDVVDAPKVNCREKIAKKIENIFSTILRVLHCYQKVLKNITSDGRIQATKYKFYILECDNT